MVAKKASKRAKKEEEVVVWNGSLCMVCSAPASYMIAGTAFCGNDRDDIMKTAKKKKEEDAKMHKAIDKLVPKPKDAPSGFYG